jgi:hypothetical protein
MKLVEDAAFFSDGLMNIESIKFAMNYIDILDLSKEVTAKDIAKLKESLIVFFKTYDKNIDLDFFKKLIPVIKKYKEDHPQFHFRSFFYGKKSLRNELKEKNLALLMSKSIFSDSARFEKAKNLSDKKFIEVARKDFVLLLAHEQSFIFNRQVVQKFIANKKSLDSIQRVSFNKTKNYSRYFYPDANATLRLSFGHIKKFMCTDAVEYDYQTFTSGIIDKVDSRNAEYVVDSSYYRFLKSNMNQPVCFIANCHTTGGNSGSPVLDARGNMLGLNCDRNIQGTVNDYIYDEKRVRNIVVDASYIIFILKAFSHANHIVNSLSIIDRE